MKKESSYFKKRGVGLSVLIDILNPEVIIIGSIFSRSRNLLWEECKKVIDKEALPCAASVCKVVTSGLGEKIGDYAALSLAVKAYDELTSSFSEKKK